VAEAVEHPVVAAQAAAGDGAVERRLHPVAAHVVGPELLEQPAVQRPLAGEHGQPVEEQPVRHRPAVEQPARHAGPAVDDGRHQRVDVVGAQAHQVGVEEHDHLGGGGGHAGPERLALAPPGLAHDAGAGARRHGGRAVGRAVVDHDHLVDPPRPAGGAHDGTDGRGLVPGGHDGSDAGHGRRNVAMPAPAAPVPVAVGPPGGPVAGRPRGCRGAGAGTPSGVHVVLVGPMGVGKSTIGRKVAALLGRPLRDSDDDLHAQRGIRGRELAQAEGVDALHRWEAEHLLRSLRSSEPSVVAAAASVVDVPEAVAALAEPFVVWLRAPVPVLAGRIRATDHRRDLGADAEARMSELEARRHDGYAGVADVAVDSGGAGPDDVVRAIADELPGGVAGQGAG
jgi:shikimate kinase